MPALNDMTRQSLSGFQAVENPKTPPPATVPGAVLGGNRYLRCPLPPFNSSPDVLRQFNESGKVPATRVIPLPVATTLGTGTTVTEAVSTFGSGSSSGGGASSTTNSPVATPAIVSVPAVAAGSSFTTIIQASFSFQLLSVSANQPLEVRLYGSALAQTSDAPRLIDTAVPFESAQNVITDVVLDTVPYKWTWQNRVGNNADSPQSANLYVSVRGLSGAALSPAMVTILYAPIVRS